MSDTDIHIVKCNVLNALQSAEIIALKDRIERLEEENDAMRADLLLWREDKP